MITHRTLRKPRPPMLRQVLQVALYFLVASWLQ